MATGSGKRRRWLRRSVIAVLIVVLALFVGACGELVYLHALWEAGNRRCGEALQPGEYGGWSIGFNGRTDAFVCTVHDARSRVVARTEVPVEDVMGASGRLPYIPALVAHEMEAVDKDAPSSLGRPRKLRTEPRLAARAPSPDGPFLGVWTRPDSSCFHMDESFAATVGGPPFGSFSGVQAEAQDERHHRRAERLPDRRPPRVTPAPGCTFSLDRERCARTARRLVVVLENEDHHAERQRGGHMSEPFAGPRRAWAWERWLPLAGVGAVVLWVIGFIVQGESPDPFEANAREWVTYVSDNDGQILASRLLTLFGVLLFLWFLGTLRTALRAAEGEPGPWAAIAFGSGIALAVLLFAATTPLLAAAATSGAVEAGAAQALAVSEIGFFFAAEVAAASLLIATGLLALRTGVLTVWLGWASLVIALLLLIVDTPIGFIAFLLGFQLWVIIVSVLLSLRSREAAA